jgi:hypothetical protein
VFTFSHGQGNQPSALKSWFYRGDNVGVAFSTGKPAESWRATDGVTTGN